MDSNNIWENLSAGSESYGENHVHETPGQETLDEEALSQEALGPEAFDYELLRNEVPGEPCTELQADQVEAESIASGTPVADAFQDAAEMQDQEVEAEEGAGAVAVRAANPFALLVAPETVQAAAKSLAGQKHARRRHSMDTKPVKPLRGELAEYDAAIDREEEEPEGQWGGSAGSARSAAGMVAGLLGH